MYIHRYSDKIGSLTFRTLDNGPLLHAGAPRPSPGAPETDIARVVWAWIREGAIKHQSMHKNSLPQEAIYYPLPSPHFSTLWWSENPTSFFLSFIYFIKNAEFIFCLVGLNQIFAAILLHLRCKEDTHFFRIAKELWNCKGHAVYKTALSLLHPQSLEEMIWASSWLLSTWVFLIKWISKIDIRRKKKQYVASTLLIRER